MSALTMVRLPRPGQHRDLNVSVEPADHRGRHFCHGDDTTAIEGLKQGGGRVTQSQSTHQEPRALRRRQLRGEGAQRGFGLVVKAVHELEPVGPDHEPSVLAIEFEHRIALGRGLD